MRGLPISLAALVDQLSTLPGVGAKSALRMALNLISRPPEECQELANALATLHQQVGFCPQCGSFSERGYCAICNDLHRNHALLCVVEQPVDVLMVEKGGFAGGYHVLHGRLSPIDGIGPEQLTITALEQRIANGTIEELVLATSATIDGEATAYYLANAFADCGIAISRIARGVPEGGELEYIDEFTLSRALEQRIPWK
ncbi:MAG: recombination mediator RecR [Mariprofundales bacterium]|nr:recombination mediator RecR [Mariprofundales bacterium]